MAKTARDTRPFSNCKRLTMWKMTDEENETYEETPRTFGKRLTTFSDSVATNSTELYGDGELVETVTTEGVGTLGIGIHYLTIDERVDLYGEELKYEDTVVSTGDEIAPYQCVACIKSKHSGMVELVKYFKAIFTKHEENVTQQESGGINYSMITLNGTYSKNMALNMKSARAVVDSRTAEGKAFIEKWFATAAFIGEEPDSGSGGE